MYIYHTLINALSAHMIHINLNMICYTHVEHSPTKTIYIKYYKKIKVSLNRCHYIFLIKPISVAACVLLPCFLSIPVLFCFVVVFLVTNFCLPYDRVQCRVAWIVDVLAWEQLLKFYGERKDLSGPSPPCMQAGRKVCVEVFLGSA